VEQSDHYDARSAAILVWSHHWADPAIREASETIGTLYVHWDKAQTASEHCLLWCGANSTLLVGVTPRM
jgi:hypothetical protein